MKGKVWATATPPLANLASQIAVGWASRWGSPHLGKQEAGGIPCQGLPTLGSCSYAAKGALGVLGIPSLFSEASFQLQKLKSL
jgi:hypothetical protein